ncbi:MAG: hypothetical protein IKS83_00790 [Victivallales bacterium]|nr:hypothetical protein [Victivallales bacterium]
MSQTLSTGLKRIGTLAPDANAISKGSCWMLGCETLDRDFADFQQYKKYIPALGIPLIRLQAGWAKTEKTPGVYDFAWLDRIVDDAMGLGLHCLLETDYGNPIYEGGGGYDLGSGFPKSEIALKAWDAWVAALVEHFKDRVQDWSIWNEPDWQQGIIPQDIAHFNIRTAAVIRQHQPDARIAGLSLSRPDQLGWFEWSLKTLRETDTEDWFDSYIYHSYHYNPDDGTEDGVRLKLLMKRFGFKGRIRQGESGCPSEATEKFALNGYPWSELTQAKWDLRRYIGDFCDGVPSNVFTICDFNHIGRQINRKGLLMADENHQVIRPKLVYWAIRNMTTLFNDGLEILPGGCTARYVNRTQAFAMERKTDQARQVVYWDRSGIPGEGNFTGHADVVTFGFHLKACVVIDPLSGAVYEFPKEQICECAGRTLYLDAPCGDSPLVLADRAMIELAKDE